jgi:hypothetical protein
LAKKERGAMGLKVFQINGGREALELECDGPEHSSDRRTAWLAAGSRTTSLVLPGAAGWTERCRDQASQWLCPACASRKRARKAAL